MDVGLKHLFLAFAVAWALHLGYLLKLSMRQKRLAREIEELKKNLDGGG